jgi:RNA polymerase sigma factor (sigma-70 family)
MTTATIESFRIPPPRSSRTDYELARAAGSGDVAAFEALYERHHLALLSFSRHMLGRLHDAEDVVQHTFAAADAGFRAGRVPASVRAWLYTVARNRCISIMRGRRDERELPDAGVAATANLADEVEQREDLRALLADLRTLPDDQRAALLLAELGELSHAEVAQVVGVRTRKVKGLVYQARQALMAAAAARAIPCRSIQEELAVASGAARRRRHLRDHVDRCDGCRAYASGVARQRASIAAILPVVPTIALRDGVLGSVGAAGATAVTGGASAGLGALGAKLLAITAIGGAAAGGGTVAVTQLEQSGRDSRTARSAAPAPPPVAPVADGPAGRAPAAQGPAVAAASPVGARPEAVRRRTGRTATAKRRRAAANERASAKPDTPRGRPVSRVGRQPRDRSADGRAPTVSAPRSNAPPAPPGSQAAMPTLEQPAPPVRSATPEPQATESLPQAAAQREGKERKAQPVRTR